MIKGDLDSIRPDVKAYYSGLVRNALTGNVPLGSFSLYLSKGIPVIQDPDQNSTDLMKCLESAKELSAFGDLKVLELCLR